MDLSKVAPVALVLLGSVAHAYDAPSVDFVSREGLPTTYRSVECTARHGESGLLSAVPGQWRDGAVEVDLRRLLAGRTGLHTVVCAATAAETGERYTAEFEAVRFAKSSSGNQAPYYDEDGFGYGVRIPFSKTRVACYIKGERVMDSQCLRAFYGEKRYYLDATPGIASVRFQRWTEFSSDVGVYLADNPRYGNR